MCKGRIEGLFPDGGESHFILIDDQLFVPDVTAIYISSAQDLQIKAFSTLDMAAMTAANEIYRASEREKWKIEFGMGIHGNEDENNFCLTEIIRGTEDELKMRKVMEDKFFAHTFKAHVHSHPTDPPYMYANEFSSYDYLESLTGHNGRFFPIYLVINVGAKGTLIKFTPPSNTRLANNGRGPFYENPEMPRDEKVRVVGNMLGDNRWEWQGRLEKTPVITEFGNNNIVWENLSPQTILWKTSATTVTASQNEKRRRMHLVIKDGVMEKEWYDLKNTIKTVIFEDSVTIIRDHEFSDFIGLEFVTISANVITIGVHVFSACVNLRTIEILPSNNNIQIGENAFNGCIGLTSIIIQNPNPPIIRASTFGQNTMQTAYLYVPRNSIIAYRQADGWRKFKNIFPLEG